jgi:hypothetical protein
VVYLHPGAAAHGTCVDAIGSAALGLGLQPSTEGLVHHLSVRCTGLTRSPFQAGGDIVIEGEGGPLRHIGKSDPTAS